MAFEAVLAGRRPGSRRWRRVTVAISIGAHAVALSIGLAYSFWTIEDLPMPAVAVTLVGGAPPPPPPPPAKRHSTGKPHPHVEKPHTLVQPKEHPQEAPKEKPEKDEDDAKDDGQEGGVKGGVSGGVVGGVVGAPVPKDTGPRLVSPQIARMQLLIDPNAEPYKVTLPPPLVRTGMTFSAVVRVCVSTQGTVSEVKVLRGADPAIDPQIPTVLGRWRYRPYLIDGHPVPFCYTIRYDVSAR
ncbi:MAG TPA: energy transducer TonB [Polyangia bacterium]|jgi:protein TonB